jgi:predicted metalloprotease with PDZ domain
VSARRSAVRCLSILLLGLPFAGCSRAPVLRYEVSVDPARPGALRVVLSIDPVPAGGLALRGYAAHQVMRVEGLEATSPDGSPLSIESRLETVTVNNRTVDLPRFEVAAGRGGPVRVAWSVAPGTREGDSHVGFTGRCHGYAGPEFVLAAGRGLFLVPQPAEKVRDIEVRFRLPEGWTAMVPWAPAGEGWRPAIGGRFAAEHLVAAPIGLGRFRERHIAAGGDGSLRLAFENSVGAAEEEAAVARIDRVAAYLARLFGRGPGKEYLVIAAPRAPTGDEIAGEGWGTGQGQTFVPMTANRLHRFAENLLDAYLRHAPNRTEVGRPEEYWLVDGLRNFYSWRAVSESGLVPRQEIDRSLAVGYLTSIGMHGVVRDLERLYSQEGTRRAEKEMLAPFVLAVLDRRLREESQGAASLDTVVAAAFRGRKARSLWDALPASKDGPWEEFRERYVKGGADLIPVEDFYRLEAAREKPEPPAGPVARRLQVAYTGKTDGYLENCGCKTNQAGGVARRATVLARLRRSRPDLLVLDAGNLFIRPEKQSSLDFLSRQEQRLYLDLVDRMRYAAAAVGTNELTLGLDHFREHAAAMATPFVAANVLRDGRPIARAALSLAAGGLRVAVLGVFEPPYGRAAASLYEEHTAGLTILDPVETLKREVPALARQADLVIALGRLSPPTIRVIAREVPGLDMVVSSEYDAPAGGEGGADLHREDHSGFVGRLLVAYTNLTSYGLMSVGLGVDRDGRIAEAVFEDHWLYEDVPDDPAVRDLLNRFYDRVGRQAAAQESVPPLFADDPERVAGRYVGQARCAACHEDQHKQWMMTKHASAYKTLLDRHRHFQPKCVSCHVVGYGTPHGYRLGMPEQTLANVQCEMCHGPGAAHAAEPSAANIRKVVPEQVCVECHNAEHSDHFVYAERLPRVKHDYFER